MTRCERCGAESVGGRFCTSCGHQLTPAPAIDEASPGSHAGDNTGDDGRTDTAERPAVDWGAPPPTHVPPPPPRQATSHQPAPHQPAPRPSSPPPPAPAAAGGGPRFPLFADEAASTRVAPTVPPAPHQTSPHQTTQHPLPPQELAPTPVDGTRRRGWLPWAVIGVVLVLLVVFGYWLATGPFGSAPSADHAHGAHAQGSGGAGSGSSGSSTDVARQATAQVPATAPPNQDTDGNMVRYDGRNMLDGVPTTCWRMAGDGTGATITFGLAHATKLTTVGLINGYAKSAYDARGHVLDWYHGNRRVLRVEWSFDDGTTLTQDLSDTRSMQTLRLDHPVTTSTVRLRLVKVSSPGRGPAARDYTPISDVTLRGTPG